MTEDKERFQQIKELRLQKLTLQQIGDAFSISRERVRQILLKSRIPRKIRLQKGKPCINCGLKLGSKNARSYYSGYCQKCYYHVVLHPESRYRFLISIKGTPCIDCKQTIGEAGARLRCRNCYNKYIYHTNPIRRAKLKEAMKAVYARRKIRYATDPVFREHMLEASKRSYQKKAKLLLDIKTA